MNKALETLYALRLIAEIQGNQSMVNILTVDIEALKEDLNKTEKNT